MCYNNLSKEELQKELDVQLKRYSEYKAKNLNYDITRGKPSVEQLQLSLDILNTEYIGDCKSDGIDCRNYGQLEGIPQIRRFFACVLGTKEENVIAGGNSSLNMMYDIIADYMLFGTESSDKPWFKYDKIKFLCPVPGYDRHFTICEKMGIEMIPIPMVYEPSNKIGPDMDMIEELVANDPTIKGMWSVPKYSNPTGITYADDVVRRLASMKCAAHDFKIFWDDAYAVHFLEGEPDKILSLIDECEKAGNPDRAICITSTSKITFPGGGVAAIAGSLNTVNYIKKCFTTQTIGPDKLNQLRHINYIKDYPSLMEHMAKHAKILAPKFKAVIDVLEEEVKDCNAFTFTKPTGGYFISVDMMVEGAARAVGLAKECGVAFTPAGSTYPYRKNNTNIRVAPSFPPVEQIPDAIRVLSICMKIATLEKLLEI